MPDAADADDDGSGVALLTGELKSALPRMRRTARMQRSTVAPAGLPGTTPMRHIAPKPPTVPLRALPHFAIRIQVREMGLRHPPPEILNSTGHLSAAVYL